MHTANDRNTESRLKATPVAGPWPSYSGYRHLSERDRWMMYSRAKREREDMQVAGFQFSETYDQFVRRVIDELEI